MIPDHKIQEVRDRAEIYQVVSDYVALKRVGSSYLGLCPFHGEKTPSFNVTPAKGIFHCFGCGAGGDAFAFIMKSENLGFIDAVRLLARRFGVDLEETGPQQQQAPRAPRPAPAGWQPQPHTPPCAQWQAKAEEFVKRSVDHLMQDTDALDYLSSRGLPLHAVEKYRLGLCPGQTQGDKIGPLYQARAAWGIPVEIAEDGHQVKSFIIPPGLVIPTFEAGKVFRLRVRLNAEYVKVVAERDGVHPGKVNKYHQVKGSGRGLVIRNPQARAFIPVESDLDDLLLDFLAGDLACPVALTSCSVRPCDQSAAVLARAETILVGLDTDALRLNAQKNKVETAGGSNSQWWMEQFRQAVRWPIPARYGKDPGEALEKGLDLRAWVSAGLSAARSAG